MSKYIVKNDSSNRSHKRLKGFSAVELLVTIFIAVLFLATGYTLYGAIVTSSSQHRHRAQADNIAFEYLRRYEKSSAIAPSCIVSNPLLSRAPVTGPSAGDLGDPSVTISIACPNYLEPSLSVVLAVVKYTEGGVDKYVTHEVYATAE